jgi:hypothetical protein
MCRATARFPPTWTRHRPPPSCLRAAAPAARSDQRREGGPVNGLSRGDDAGTGQPSRSRAALPAGTRRCHRSPPSSSPFHGAAGRAFYRRPTFRSRSQSLYSPPVTEKTPGTKLLFLALTARNGIFVTSPHYVETVSLCGRSCRPIRRERSPNLLRIFSSSFFRCPAPFETTDHVTRSFSRWSKVFWIRINTN